MKTTSKLAYKSIQEHLPPLHTKIIQALKEIGKGTFREIAKAANLRDEQVWKRLSELKKKGEVIDDLDTKICPVSGRVCGVWKINE